MMHFLPRKWDFVKNRPFQASNTLVNYTQSGEDNAPPDSKTSKRITFKHEVVLNDVLENMLQTMYML